MDQPTGSHPSSVSMSQGSVGRIIGDVLGDTSDSLVASLNGDYIDLGSGFIGGVPSGALLVIGNIESESILPGSSPQIA